MTDRAALRRLEAYAEGKPVSNGTLLRLPKIPAKRTFVLAFVRMGGESRPWGVAFGKASGSPKVLTVGEARNRELVGGMLEELTPELLEHLESSPHVWVPNASHIEMLHFLAFTYTFAKRGDPKRIKVLNALGRAANWLFEESTRPGQWSCIDASRALRDAYAFPCEDVRQAHTGYLLAWLETRGDFNKRLAAASEAELLSVSTSLDPKLERDTLADLVEKHNAERRAGRTAAAKKCADAIHTHLEPELRRRFEVAVRAHDVLLADRRKANSGLEQLGEEAQSRHEDYLSMEQRIAEGGKAYVRSPETDRHSLVAASSYITAQADEDRFVSALVHYDPEMQADMLASGDGLRGKIVKIRDEGDGRRTVAIWTIDEDAARPLRVREGDALKQAGYSKRAAVLRSTTTKRDGGKQFELQITSGIRPGEGPFGREPLDRWWKGKAVTFLSLGEPGFSYMRRKMLWKRGGPGAWLTHKQPWERVVAADEDDHDTDAEAV